MELSILCGVGGVPDEGENCDIRYVVEPLGLLYIFAVVIGNVYRD